MTQKYRCYLAKNECWIKIALNQPGIDIYENVNYQINSKNFTGGKIDFEKEQLILSTPFEINEYPNGSVTNKSKTFDRINISKEAMSSIIRSLKETVEEIRKEEIPSEKETNFLEKYKNVIAKIDARKILFQQQEAAKKEQTVIRTLHLISKNEIHKNELYKFTNFELSKFIFELLNAGELDNILNAYSSKVYNDNRRVF